MDVVVIGGHGKIAMRLLRLLTDRGDTARGVVRKPEQAADLEAVGAEAIVCDIETEALTDAVSGADAVVFAAGAGPGSGPDRKRTVDYGGAVKLIEAAKANGISRYAIVSSIGAHDPSVGDGDFRAYLEAKHDADEALIASGLDYTIVRPGSLSDDPGTGLVELHTEMGHRASVPRDDVAAVLAEVLVAANTIGLAFELFEGETPVPEAVRAL
ncbi:MAG: SDR family oxidoreductase [Actinomycetota bacterium]|nr:SDR family oxidoreductase [Actinomycetota bacterium]